MHGNSIIHESQWTWKFYNNVINPFFINFVYHCFLKIFWLFDLTFFPVFFFCDSVEWDSKDFFIFTIKTNKVISWLKRLPCFVNIFVIFNLLHLCQLIEPLAKWHWFLKLYFEIHFEMKHHFLAYFDLTHCWQGCDWGNGLVLTKKQVIPSTHCRPRLVIL